jgi:cytochrome c-type biogenesis protein CcmH
MKLSRRAFYICFLLALWLIVAFSAGALAADPQREIEDKLIAPCCWSQPVSQHDSEASRKIKREVAEMLAAGKSQDQIIEHFVSEYGERILVAPRPKGFNSLAYVLPWTALLLGAGGIAILLKKMRVPGKAAVQSAPVTDSKYDSIIEKEIKDLDE